MAISLEEAERRLNAGSTKGITEAQFRQLEQIEARNNQAAKIQQITTPGALDTGQNQSFIQPQRTTTSAEDDYYAKKAADEKLEKQTSAREYLRTLLTQYNMGSLAGQIEGLIQESTNQDFLAEKVRQTNEYKARFKGLLALQGRGNTDVRNEAEYLNLETEYRSAFRDAGLRNYLGTDGSQSEYDSIADLVGKYSVSVEEVKSRIGDAQRVVADTPQEVRDSLQKFYNIDPLTLVEYSLDPARTQNKINSLANAAIVGGYAARGGLNIDVTGAEFIGDLAGDSDIALQPLNTEVQRGAALRDATKRLADIEKSELSDTESLTASMGADAKAQKKVEGLQSRERARFSGSGAFNTGSLKGGRRV